MFSNALLEYLQQQKQLLRQLQLTQNHPLFPQENIVPKATYAPWRSDKDFFAAYQMVKNNTLVDEYRLYELWKLIPQVASLGGCIVEVGVWRGGSAGIMAQALKLARVSIPLLLFDTFLGVVKAGEMDTNYLGGEHADTSIETVKQLIIKTGYENTAIREGVFPDNQKLSDSEEKIGISLIHIDVDTYESAREIANYAFKWLLPGGIMIFDDYGFWGCEGVTRMVNEHEWPNSRMFYNLNGHAIVFKY